MGNADAYSGGFAQPAFESAYAFRAAMRAMARPGTIETLEGALAPSPLSSAAATLLLVLCDPDTGLSLHGAHDNLSIRQWINFHTGAPSVSSADATFALGDWDALNPVDRFHNGSPEYPDRAVTLIVEQDTLIHEGARLTGPGIATEAFLNLPESNCFAENRARFPLGFDCFFTANTSVAALPRSTCVSFTRNSEAA
jgi:alpha-D-ribose 1-methylphosphonate 5-triphosphate synthase subunit PhnH